MRKKQLHESEIEEIPMNIYDAKQREEMLKNNEISITESAFMDGRELALKKRLLDVW